MQDGEVRPNGRRGVVAVTGAVSSSWPSAAA